MLYERVVDARVLGETPTYAPRAPARGAYALSVTPNPVRSEAVVSLTLAHAAFVTLEIVDVAGRVVRRFDHGRMPAGRSRLAVQMPRPAGVYGLRATADGTSQAAVVVVLR
jgi:hypothetical protein